MATAVIEGGASPGWLDDALEARSLATGKGLHPPDDAKIGVLFVHGIGSQRPGETLLSWSRSLLALVGGWTARHGGPYQVVRRASIDFTGTTIPYVEVDLPKQDDAHPAQTWVMTEAYWAAQIRPPTVGEMFDWLVLRRVGVRLARQLARGIARSLGVIAIAERAVLFVAVPAALIVAIAAFLVSRALALIPVPWLQRNIVVRSFDYFLGDWFGDVRIVLIDRVQAANVRSNVRRAIYALRSYGCGPIVVVGHSGGTFVSYMTLAEFGDKTMPASRLITHGQALGIAWMLGDACRAIDPDDEDALQEGDALRRDLQTIRPKLEWYDFHSTHDPAPAGGFEHAECVVSRPWAPGQSTTVYNEASFRADHGAYWDNTEGFVVPVARLIETASPATPVSRFFEESVLAAGQKRRHARVRALHRAKVAIAGLAAAAILVVGPLNPVVDRLVGREPANVETIGRDAYRWLANVAAPLAELNDGSFALTLLPPDPGDAAWLVGLLVLTIAFVVPSSAATRVWRGWDRLMRRRFLGPRTGWPDPIQLEGALLLCVAASVLLVFFASTGAWALVLAGLLLLVTAWAWQMLAVAALGRRREPEPGDGTPAATGTTAGDAA